MRRTFLLFLAFCLLTILTAEAQSNTATPTTEDAIAFINKVYSQFPVNTVRVGISESRTELEKIKFDNCKLYFYYYAGNFSADGTSFNLICNIINLSDAVLIKDNGTLKLYPNTPKSIKSYVIHTPLYGENTIKEYTNKLEKYVETGSFENEIKPGGVVNAVGTITTDFEYIDVLSVCNQNQLFINGNYADRIKKAYDLVIKNCGGDRLKVDPNDKF